jgi:hypothetical protein
MLTDYSMSNVTYRYFNGNTAVCLRQRLELYQIRVQEGRVGIETSSRQWLCKSGVHAKNAGV